MIDSAHSHKTAVRHAVPSDLIHDLRTPLNQIIGYSDLLTEMTTDEALPDTNADLRKLRAAGQKLLSLINDSFYPIPRLPEVADLALLGESELSQDSIERLEDGQSEPAPVIEAFQQFLLVVDDIESNRDVLSRRLRRMGHLVATAENGEQAMKMLRAATFDMVLLDIMMPVMDGYQVLESLKADPELLHIPVIMISALSELDSVVRCIELGADDYLTKPFNPILLKARVGACLEKKKAYDREAALFGQLEENFKRLEQLEKLRDDLTHMIIHDLRTPLTSVIAGMFSMDSLGDLNPCQREVMGIAVSGGQTLLGMIDDLLDVEKLESGVVHLDYEKISVAGLAEAAISQVASLAYSKHLKLEQMVAPDLGPIQCDEPKLCRTLVNLLGNAIKFSGEGGTVTLAAESSWDGASILFTVADTGEGIPTEALERIFEKFGQVESRAAGRTSSTGLGLTFCKLAVETHGGQIGVESVLGEGSKFWFTIPILSPFDSAQPEIPDLVGR